MPFVSQSPSSETYVAAYPSFVEATHQIRSFQSLQWPPSLAIPVTKPSVQCTNFLSRTHASVHTGCTAYHSTTVAVSTKTKQRGHSPTVPSELISRGGNFRAEQGTYCINGCNLLTAHQEERASYCGLVAKPLCPYRCAAHNINSPEKSPHFTPWQPMPLDSCTLCRSVLRSVLQSMYSTPTVPFCHVLGIVHHWSVSKVVNRFECFKLSRCYAISFSSGRAVSIARRHKTTTFGRSQIKPRDSRNATLTGGSQTPHGTNDKVLLPEER